MTGPIISFVVGGVFAAAGIALLLNLFGAADSAAARGQRIGEDPDREAGTRPATRGSIRAWGLVALVSGGAAIAGAISELSGTPTAISCAYAGAPVRALTITVRDGVGVIARRGTGIAVREQGESPARCAGATPTVQNTDTIRIELRDVSFIDIDLGGGAFAPGATTEEEGAPEIEIQVRPDLGTAEILGTSGDDEWHWGPAGANPGLNLNPREAGDRDVDVSVVGTQDLSGALVANGGDGDDTIIAAPGAVVRGQVFAFGDAGNDRLGTPVISGLREYGAELHGGAGDDAITGGGHDDELLGDGGDDRIDGRGGADTITGGRGRDRISAGAGPDTIRTRDDARDVVSCGAGRDRASVDALDALDGCEQVAKR
jgi:hypothetical protein